MSAESETVEALVIGAGPAGLMAAEALAGAGLSVVVVDRMPSVARKLLMAGKSGLNLTKAEPFERFLAAYGEGAEWLRPMLGGFRPRRGRRLGAGAGAGSVHRFHGPGLSDGDEGLAAVARLAGAARMGRGSASVPAGPGVAGRRARWCLIPPRARAASRAGVTVAGAWRRQLAAAGIRWRLGGMAGAGRSLRALEPAASASAGRTTCAPQFGAPVKAVALQAGGAGEPRGVRDFPRGRRGWGDLRPVGAPARGRGADLGPVPGSGRRNAGRPAG